MLIAIGRLHNWRLTWQLQIAIDKCFVCTVSNVHHHNPGCSSTAYSICNQMFASVDCVRDLGVMIDSKLKFDKHIAGIVHKAMSRANLILKSFHSRDRTLLTTAFCTYVRPLLKYCSSVWSAHTKCLINEIEKIQRYFTWNTSYDDRLSTLGLQSLEHRRVLTTLFCVVK